MPGLAAVGAWAAPVPPVVVGAVAARAAIAGRQVQSVAKALAEAVGEGSHSPPEPGGAVEAGVHTAPRLPSRTAKRQQERAGGKGHSWGSP